LQAQDTLRLDEVISTAIQNNYNIKIAKVNLAMANNNATVGMAGFLPTADIGANYTYSNSLLSKTTFNSNIPDQNVNNAASHNYGADANLRYTLFDGLKPLYTLRKNKVDVQLGNTQLKQSIESTVYTVMQAYYNLAILQEDERIAKQKLELTKTQLKRVSTKRKYGQGSEVERLNLLTTYNVDSTQLLRLALSKRQAVRQLNRAIGSEEVTEEVLVNLNTTLDLNVTYESVVDAAKQNNLSVLQAEQNIRKSELDLKITESELYPKLNTTVSFGYNGSSADAGIVNTNSSVGPSVNLALTYTFYSGGRLKPARQNAQLGIKNAQLNKEMMIYELEQNIKEAWTTHENNIALIPIEQSNVAVSKQSFERTEKAYKLGQATLLDYQQAQFNYIQAQKQLIQARYNTKLSEWELRRLSGRLTD